MSCAPARVFKLPGGTLRRGALADVTVFDPERELDGRPGALRVEGAQHAVRRPELRGRASCTIVGGRIVHSTAT